MASPSNVTHGKFANIYRLRPSGFVGVGLNDATWGAGYSGGGSSAYFEVQIDAAGTPDTFQWRKDGGAWTTGVAITGAAQTLSDSQAITFAATTGHVVGDEWTICNLDTEACSESGVEAQITDAGKRIINPNATVIFTDSGAEKVLTVNYTSGLASFTGNVTVVTVSGNNGYIRQDQLEHVAYGYSWAADPGLDLAESSAFQQKWKTYVPGQAGVTGSFESYMVASVSGFDAIEAAADGTQKYFFIELYNYDPDGDQTGDRMLIWATMSGFGTSAGIGDVIKETLNWQAHGPVSFTANS